MKHFFALLNLAILPLTSCQSKVLDHPVEVGPATFLRDFEEAAVVAQKENKPIFAFFQEVPG